MSNPEISVIIPVFNVQDYLPECLSSLADQTFGRSRPTDQLSFEVILVDDGSTDNSGVVAQEFIDAHQISFDHFTVSLISKANHGASLARRDGVAVATGEWLAFVDSDDWVDARYLELLYLKAKETDSDVVACGLVRTVGKGAESKVVSPVPSRRASRAQDPRFEINTYPLLWNKLWRGSLIDRWLMAGGEFPGADVSLGEDFALTYGWAAAADAVSWIPDGLYFYRMREGSAFNDRWKNPGHRRSTYLAIRHMIQESVKLDVFDRFYEEFAAICVMHLIRSNPQEIRSAMMGDAAAEQYCIAALSLLNEWFPDWAETTAQNKEERLTFMSLRDALVQKS
jgi:glycosyltransferase involved in cell wall biosynthesis